jgi:hypothetical protein
MEDLIEMAKTQYNFTVINMCGNWYRITSKYFTNAFDHESLDNEIQNMYLKDTFYEMLKEKLIYDVKILSGNMYINDYDMIIITYPDNIISVKKKHCYLKHYCLKTQFYNILNDFPEYFRSDDIKIALK